MIPQNQNAMVPPKKSTLHFKAPFFSNLKKKCLSKAFRVTFFILFVFIVIELLFDVIEITFGEIINWTNPLRPQIGAVWSLEFKDQTASDQLNTIIEDIPEKKEVVMDINSFEQLLQALETQKEVVISKENFIKIYTRLPHAYAQEIISPFEMIPLVRRNNWINAKISKGDTELRIYLVNGAEQLVRDFYPRLSRYYAAAAMRSEPTVTLEQFDEFDGRIISADQFYEAYNSLSLAKRVYIMNDPYQLLKWGDTLKRVAISRYVIDGGVSIGFEAKNGAASVVHQYQASELAATHLVNRINQSFPEISLPMPERKEIEIDTQ